MMTTTETRGRSLGVRLGRAAMFSLLALAATLYSASEARAQWATNGNNINNTNTGNVGIGTTAPAAILDAQRMETTDLLMRLWNTNPGASTATFRIANSSNSGSRIQFTDSMLYVSTIFAERTGGLRFRTGNASSEAGLVDRMSILPGGNVGIGTAEPGSKMVISANAAAPLAPNPANPSVFAPQDGTILHIVNADTQKTRVTIDSFGNNAGPSVSFRAGRGTLSAPAATLSGDALGIVYGGGFGVSRFHSGAKPAMWMVATENWTDTAAGSAIFFNTVPNGSTATVERMRISDGGNVGVGTTTPGVVNGANFTGYIPLHIKGQGANPASIAVDSASPLAGLVINDSSQPADSRMWAISQAAGGGKLTFRTYSDAGTVVSDKVVIDRSGKVGVGTTAPTAMLHVAGDIRVDGNISAKYQDVAEWVPSTQKLAAGTVVILDIERNNHVTTTAVAYDTRVAGVVSAQPGISLGEAGDDKSLIATTGRVKVKVDATRAPIRVGDLLVTGDTPGVAMRSQPLDLGGVPIHRPGTIIGKALESLEKGTGEILVLLSLQ